MGRLQASHKGVLRIYGFEGEAGTEGEGGTLIPESSYRRRASMACSSDLDLFVHSPHYGSAHSTYNRVCRGVVRKKLSSYATNKWLGFRNRVGKYATLSPTLRLAGALRVGVGGEVASLPALNCQRCQFEAPRSAVGWSCGRNASKGPPRVVAAPSAQPSCKRCFVSTRRGACSLLSAWGISRPARGVGKWIFGLCFVRAASRATAHRSM